jgi:hypothetical protein
MVYLNADISSGISVVVDKVMDFTEWKFIIGDRKVEILAGQH